MAWHRLLFLHHLDRLVEESLQKTLASLVDSGLLRYLGAKGGGVKV
jgi:aryl-alcohol dehydrogenase-like predicted oxidoreductase